MAYVKSEYEASMVQSFTVNATASSKTFTLSWSKPPIINAFSAYRIYYIPGDIAGYETPPVLTLLGTITNINANTTDITLTDDLGTFTFGIVPAYSVRFPGETTLTGIVGKINYTTVNNINISEDTSIIMPTGIDADADGNIYFLNGIQKTGATSRRIISKVDTSGAVTNITAGTVTDDDTTPNVQLAFKNNNLYYNYASLWKTTTAGVETSYTANYPISTYWGSAKHSICLTDETNYIYYTNESATYWGGITNWGGSTETYGLYKRDITKTGSSRAFVAASGYTATILNTINTGTSSWLYDVELSNIGNTADLQIGQRVSGFTDAIFANGFFNGSSRGLILSKTSSSVVIRMRGLGSEYAPDVIATIFNQTAWQVDYDILITGKFRWNTSPASTDIAPTSDWWNSDIQGGLGPMRYYNGFIYALRTSGTNFGDNYDSLVKVNPVDGSVTFIANGLKSSSISLGNNYAQDLTIVNGDVYIAGGSRIIKVAPDGTKTVIAGGDARGIPADGAGVSAKFINACHITYNPKDGFLYVSDTGSVTISSVVTTAGGIRTVSLDGIVGPKDSSDTTDTSAGNADVSGGSDISLGNNGWSADIPPAPGEGTSGTVDITTPEGETIASIPISGGWAPDDVFTFRKDFDKLYLLLNGVIVWSYTLSSIQLMAFESTGYIGWYTRGNKTPTTTPSESVQYPLYGARYYTFDTDIIQQGLGEHPLFARSINKASQALIVHYDENGESFTVEERPYDLDVQNSPFVVLGGRIYSFTLVDIDNNETTYTGNSPILPQYVVDMVANSPYHVYLREVGV